MDAQMEERLLAEDEARPVASPQGWTTKRKAIVCVGAVLLLGAVIVSALAAADELVPASRPRAPQADPALAAITSPATSQGSRPDLVHVVQNFVGVAENSHVSELTYDGEYHTSIVNLDLVPEATGIRCPVAYSRDPSSPPSELTVIFNTTEAADQYALEWAFNHDSKLFFTLTEPWGCGDHIRKTTKFVSKKANTVTFQTAPAALHEVIPNTRISYKVTHFQNVSEAAESDEDRTRRENYDVSSSYTIGKTLTLFEASEGPLSASISAHVAWTVDFYVVIETSWTGIEKFEASVNTNGNVDLTARVAAEGSASRTLAEGETDKITVTTIVVPFGAVPIPVDIKLAGVGSATLNVHGVVSGEVKTRISGGAKAKVSYSGQFSASKQYTPVTIGTPTFSWDAEVSAGLTLAAGPKLYLDVAYIGGPVCEMKLNTHTTATLSTSGSCKSNQVALKTDGWVSIDASAEIGISVATFHWGPLNIYESSHFPLLDKCITVY